MRLRLQQEIYVWMLELQHSQDTSAIHLSLLKASGERQRIEDVPCPKRELSKAAECFNEEHSLMWKIWDLVGGPGTSAKKAKLFADRKIRMKTAQILLTACDKYQGGADQMENALSVW